jgi:epoxide hydrolase-like predicted phosphatase
MNKEIKAIVFDAGGVLFETDWGSVKREIMKKYNFSVFLHSDYPKKIQKRFRGLTRGIISFRKVIRELSGFEEIDEIVNDYKKSFIKHQKINRELLTLIKRLKSNYHIFCLTNTNDIHFEANIENNLFKHFKKTYSSCKIKLKKPDKRAFQVIFKENKIPKKETIFIDDKKENLATAKKLGMKTILFKNNTQLVRDLKKFGVKV